MFRKIVPYSLVLSLTASAASTLPTPNIKIKVFDEYGLADDQFIQDFKAEFSSKSIQNPTYEEGFLTLTQDNEFLKFFNPERKNFEALDKAAWKFVLNTIFAQQDLNISCEKVYGWSENLNGPSFLSDHEALNLKFIPMVLPIDSNAIKILIKLNTPPDTQFQQAFKSIKDPLQEQESLDTSQNGLTNSSQNTSINAKPGLVLLLGTALLSLGYGVKQKFDKRNKKH